MAPKHSGHVRYTIRSVPPEVDRALRKKAKAVGKTLNDTIIEALCRESGVTTDDTLHHDLDHLIGAWVDDPEFDRVMAEMDVVNHL